MMSLDLPQNDGPATHAKDPHGVQSAEGIAAALRALLQARPPEATVCPSGVARAVAPDGDWRVMMPTVHIVIDHLIASGAVRLSWKGRALVERAGPYRIASVPES